MDGSNARPAALRNGSRGRGSSVAKLDYKYSKIIGTRNNAGAGELVRLRPVHKEMIAMHLRGKTVKEIATKTGYSRTYIGRVLTSKTAKPYIDAYHDVVESDIRALAPHATEALRDAVKNGKHADQIAAAREIFKLTDRYPKDDDKGDGKNAADIVREVVDLARDVLEVRRIERNPQAHIIDNDDHLIEGET